MQQPLGPTQHSRPLFPCHLTPFEHPTVVSPIDSAIMLSAEMLGSLKSVVNPENVHTLTLKDVKAELLKQPGWNEAIVRENKDAIKSAVMEIATSVLASPVETEKAPVKVASKPTTKRKKSEKSAQKSDHGKRKKAQPTKAVDEVTRLRSLLSKMGIGVPPLWYSKYSNDPSGLEKAMAQKLLDSGCKSLYPSEGELKKIRLQRELRDLVGEEEAAATADSSSDDKDEEPTTRPAAANLLTLADDSSDNE